MSLQFSRSGSIVVGQSQSNAIQLNELTAIGVITGSNITATTLTFLVSQDGTNFYPLYDSLSTEVSLSASSVARSYSLDPLVFYPWNFIKLREGTSTSAVLQATVDTLFTVTSKLL